MKIEKLNLDGKKDTIEVLDTVFSSKFHKKLVHNVLYKANANYKGRKAKTKQKNEIIGSTSKIYAQKGTGGARHASRKAPIFIGGGVAHGPKGQSNYKKRKLNKMEKKLSISSLISQKNKSNNQINLFSDKYYATIFWIHFLTINLFCGSWIVRDYIRINMPKFLALTPIVLTYFIGPIGLVLYWFFRIFFAKKISLFD